MWWGLWPITHIKMTGTDTYVEHVHSAFEPYKLSRGLKTSGFGFCQLLGHRTQDILPGFALWSLRIGSAHKNTSPNYKSKLPLPHNIPTRSATGVYIILSDLSPPNKVHPSFGQLKLLESSSLYIGSAYIFYPLLLLVSTGNLQNKSNPSSTRQPFK